MIDPTRIMIWRDGGTGNMGDHTDEGNMTARLRAPGHRIVPVFVRGHFNRIASSGTDVADMLMIVDSGHGVFYDNELHTFENVGEGYDAVLRVPEAELMHYITDVGDEIVFEWTNPDSGDISWGLEVGYIYADEMKV